MKTIILPAVRAYYNPEVPTYPEAEKSTTTKGGYVDREQYQRFQDAMRDAQQSQMRDAISHDMATVDRLIAEAVQLKQTPKGINLSKVLSHTSDWTVQGVDGKEIPIQNITLTQGETLKLVRNGGDNNTTLMIIGVNDIPKGYLRMQSTSRTLPDGTLMVPKSFK